VSESPTSDHFASQFNIHHPCDEIQAPDSPNVLTAVFFALNSKVRIRPTFQGCLLNPGLLGAMLSVDGYQHFGGTY
jgi:hypothetical protein